MLSRAFMPNMPKTFILLVEFEVLTAVVIKSTILECSACHLLSRWILAVYSSTLKMEAICSSEKSVDFQRTTRRYIPEDGTLLLFCLLSHYLTSDSVKLPLHLSARYVYVTLQVLPHAVIKTSVQVLSISVQKCFEQFCIIELSIGLYGFHNIQISSW
jgi:hypothetical protein